MTTSPPRPFEVVADLSSLPSGAIGARHLVWWGNVGFMVIEGTGFALAAAAYLYLMTQSTVWPPVGDALPGLLWGGVFTAALVLSTVPNLWVLRCARAKKAATVRWGMAGLVLIGLILMALRAAEFAHLGVRWDRDGYGSVLWLLLVLHTTHIVTEWAKSRSRRSGCSPMRSVTTNSPTWRTMPITGPLSS